MSTNVMSTSGSAAVDSSEMAVEIVYIPRSEWPQSVLDAFDKANAGDHSIQLCRDATMLGEGCPTQNCRCTCHDKRAASTGDKPEEQSHV